MSWNPEDIANNPMMRPPILREDGSCPVPDMVAKSLALRLAPYMCTCGYAHPNEPHNAAIASWIDR